MDGATSPPNEKERRRWNDARCVAVWPKREQVTSAVTPYLMDAAHLQEGERVLDVGCGTGGTSMASANDVGPDGSIVGVDISESMLALARSRVGEAGVDTVSFVAADMQVDRLNREFDVVISQFGVMFFDEPTAAFANIRSHMRGGARMVFACWQSVDRNPWHTAAAMRPFVPPAPVPPLGKSPTGPFALGDQEETTDTLFRAGFSNVQFTGFDISVDVPGDAVTDESLYSFMGVADADLPEVKRVMDAHLKKFEIGEDLYRLPSSFWIVQASNP